MAILTFTPPVPPSPGTSTKPELKILSVDFGDGYTQESADGLNHIRKSITLSWEKLLPADCNTILAFLTTHGGVTPFYYTPSDDPTPIRWTCKEWEDKREVNGFRTVKAVFKQSFSLVG